VSGSGGFRKSRDLVFSGRTTPDLELHPRLRLELRGPHVIRLKVFTPRGLLYQEIKVPLVTPPLDGAAEGQRPAALPGKATANALPGGAAVPTGRDPADAGRPRAATTEPVRGAGARLPLAGTSITQSSLYGAWSVQPFLDDQQTPCGPATSFTITE
jgi:hypothetical protein